MKDETNTSQDKQGKSRSLGTTFLLGISLVLLLVLIGLYVVYGRAIQNLSEDKTVLSVAGILRTPVVTVNNKKVLYTDYIDDMQTLRQFYTSVDTQDPDADGLVPPPVSPVSDAEISDQVISRLVINALVSQIANRFGVTVSDDQLATTRADIITGSFQSEENANTELQRQYGWDLDTYIQKVVRPILLEQNLQQAFIEREDITVDPEYVINEIRARHILFRMEPDEDEESVKTEAKVVLDRILAGEDFAELAKEFGEDSTSEQGGDLGWFGPGIMVPEFEQAAFALADGDVSSEPVQTQFGFHLIKREETRTSRDFLRYMNDQLFGADIRFRLPIHDPFEAVRNQQGNIASPKVEQIQLPDVSSTTEESVLGE